MCKIVFLDTIALLDTQVSINNPYQKSSGIIIFLCKYSYLRYNDKLLDVFFLLLAGETKKKKLSYTKNT